MADQQNFSALFARVPEGWSTMTYNGHRYGVARTVLAHGRVQKIYAEELGGTDVISANLYAEDQLRPCEMPAAKVLDFVAAVVPETAPTGTDTTLDE